MHTTTNTLYRLDTMPRIKTGRMPGWRMTTSGLGGPVARVFTASQVMGYADYLKVRPNSLRVSRNEIADGPFYQNGGCDDFQRGDGYEESDNDGLDLLVVCHAICTKRQRSRAAARQREAENWLKAEKRIVEILSGDGTSFTCQCSTKQSVSVRHISTEGYFVKDIPMCPCGMSSSLLLRNGYFPSSPIKPRTIFSVRLLRLFHEQSIRGKMSRYAWSEGLRAAHEFELGKDIQPFNKLLRTSYHHWVAVNNEVQARTSLYLQTLEQDSPPWFPEKLQNMCPACFYTKDDPAETDNAATLTMDGNLQHKRFKDVNPEFEVFKPRVFVNFGQQDYTTAQTASGSTDEAQDGGCSNQFKATGGWKKSELSTLGKKNLDESGLMGVTCTHGIGLRYLNMHRSRERHTHGIALLDHILDESELDIRLCYDVGCVFGPAIPRLLPLEKANRVITAIGRFHIYAHQYGCHIQWNATRTKGFACTSGENCEPNWSLMSHMVAPNRVSSGPRRMQNIDAFTIYNSARSLRVFGQTLKRRWERMLAIHRKESQVLKETIGKIVPWRKDKAGNTHPRKSITLVYLVEQAADQLKYYKEYNG